MKKYDVIIIGGGMVGAATALGFAKQGRQVALIEPSPPEPFDPEQPLDLRVSSISYGSKLLLEELGAWQAIEAMRACPFKRLETWEHQENKISFHSDDIGLPELGFMVENRVVQLGLWAQFDACRHLTLYESDTLAQLEPEVIDLELQQVHRLTLDSGALLCAPLVIGADGAQSQLRNLLNIGSSGWDYRQWCMLIHVTTDEKQQEITWQQFTEAGPRSMLPLPGHNVSLVWYDSPEKIKALNALSNAKLKAEIMAQFPPLLGEFTVVKKGYFPLVRQNARRYVKRHCVLLGDAAHTINPLAGQGVNLGFMDVKTLLELSQNEPVITAEVLTQFEQNRQRDTFLMQSTMDVFYKTFSSQIAPLRWLRNSVIFSAQRSGPLKNKVLSYAVGLSS